jgi:hypothetical protein
MALPHTNTNRERMKPLPKLKPITTQVQLPKLQPYEEPTEQINALRQVKDIIEQLKTDKRILFNVIHEEMLANGGSLSSSDSDVWIQNRFGWDEDLTTQQIVTKQIVKAKYYDDTATR